MRTNTIDKDTMANATKKWAEVNVSAENPIENDVLTS